MPHNNHTQRDEELRSSILRLPRPDAQDAKYLIEVELDDLVDFIKAKQEEAVQEAKIEALADAKRVLGIDRTNPGVSEDFNAGVEQLTYVVNMTLQGNIDRMKSELEAARKALTTPTQPNKEK